jgi:hypothetical protein
MEALQMLKYDFKKQRLSFADGLRIDQLEMLEDEPEELSLEGGGQSLAQEEAADCIIRRVVREEGDSVPSDIVFVDF